MKLEVFDVDHGACSLITADNNTHLMVDCGHNSHRQWHPGSLLLDRGITRLDVLVITNYDEDHLSGTKNLFSSVPVEMIFRNQSVNQQEIQQIKSESGGIGSGTSYFFEILKNYYIPVSFPVEKFQGINAVSFYTHNFSIFQDTNNLSNLTFLDCQGIGILFTGDIEESGWNRLLLRQDFVNILPRVHILMAPHHGRKSGINHSALSQMSNLIFVVISDSSIESHTQDTAGDYGMYAQGGFFRNEKSRKVISTRNDKDIVFEIFQDRFFAN